MENNTNIDVKNENIEQMVVEKVSGVEKADKITSAKMLQSTKNIIESLNLEGNQQEKLDTLVKEYKKFLEQAQGVAKVEVVGLDLSDEFNAFSKELEVFIKKLELRTNSYMNDAVAVNVSNIEKDFKVVHDEFMRYLDEVKSIAVSSQKESEEKDLKIKELVSRVDELNDTVNQLQEHNSKLLEKNKSLDKGFSSLVVKNESLQDDLKYANAKLEKEKSLRSIDSETNYKLKNDIKDLKNEINEYKEQIRYKDTKIKVTIEEKNELEVKNKELEISLAELKTKNALLEEEDKKMCDTKKEVAEKTELVAQLEKRNQLLENDLKELNVLKVKNIELEGTVKVLESQSKLLENTLNVINNTVSSITDSKVKAEEKTNNLEIKNTQLIEENKKLLKELEELKKQLKIKK